MDAAIPRGVFPEFKLLLASVVSTNTVSFYKKTTGSHDTHSIVKF
jgi:hypothetical protein